MLQRILTLGLIAVSATSSYAATREENVVISDCVEEYNFVKGKDGRTEVKHSIKTEYLATRHSDEISPHIFHNNIVRLDKASGGKANYRNANPPTVFHDDSKVCFFNIWLDRKDRKSKVQFKRTFTDAAHFTGVFPGDDYPVRSKTITFDIPAYLLAIQLVDRNFPDGNINRTEILAPDGSRRITYTVNGLPETPSDPDSPSALASLPHILVKGYFPDTDSLYRYHRAMLDVDTVIPGVSSIIASAIDGSTDRDSIIGKLYRHVQQNVRYVAFEEGESAYRPDTPAEVLRKRYGDCKGMAMLLATLLKYAGIEAHVAAVGSRSIPFRISDYPTLSATNHMICVVPDTHGYLFLDPTNYQISSRHIPWGIRGKDAMVFMPDGYTIVDIPSESPRTSEDILTYSYLLTPEGLVGRAERRCTEDMAERLTSIYSDVPGHLLNDILAKSLIPASRAAIPSDSVRYDRSKSGEATISAPIANTVAVTASDDHLYLDLNTSNEPFTSRVSTDDRHMDYEIALPATVTRKTVVTIPGKHTITLPEDYEVSCPQGQLSCRFTRKGDTVTMTKTMRLTNTRIPLGEIAAWNKSLSEWNDACNRQIEIKL